MESNIENSPTQDISKPDSPSSASSESSVKSDSAKLILVTGGRK
jgi:hypothetical protein